MLNVIVSVHHRVVCLDPKLKTQSNINITKIKYMVIVMIKPLPEKKHEIISTVANIVNNDTVSTVIRLYTCYKILRLFV
jgi:hypothetical protein